MLERSFLLRSAYVCLDGDIRRRILVALDHKRRKCVTRANASFKTTLRLSDTTTPIADLTKSYSLILVCNLSSPSPSEYVGWWIPHTSGNIVTEHGEAALQEQRPEHPRGEIRMLDGVLPKRTDDRTELLALRSIEDALRV